MIHEDYILMIKLEQTRIKQNFYFLLNQTAHRIKVIMKIIQKVFAKKLNSNLNSSSFKNLKIHPVR